LTSTTATEDTTKETVYGTLMVGFLALFLATLFLFVTFRSRLSNPRRPQNQQASITTSYRCSACENEIVPNAKFCGNCGALLKH
jgi:hypothetical protein